MFEGVYCAKISSNTVYESILIDTFNDCINSALNSQPSSENPDSRSVEMNSASDCSSASSGDVLVPLISCTVGQNVRATYSVDGQLYEAVVKNIFGKPPIIMARVRYHGYGNEEAVPMNKIFPSFGPTAIKEQIRRARSEDDEQTGSDESVQKKIDWKKGMACRAKYEEKDLIYEATVVEVNDSEKTVFVEMLGYGTRYHAKFDQMYESIPELRKKQAAAAQKHMQEIQRNNAQNCDDRPSLGLLVACSEVRQRENESNSTDFEKKVDVISNVFSERKLEPINEEVQSTDSQTSDGVHSKENNTDYPDGAMKIDVTSAISKEPKLNHTNEKEHNSETATSGEALLKENKSNGLDFDPKVDAPADTSKEPNFETVNEQVPSSETLTSDRANLKRNKSISSDFETEPKLNNTMSASTSLLGEHHLPLSLISEEIMQPGTESEALACLLSANYLSGYYAGYYDCIRRRQNSDAV